MMGPGIGIGVGIGLLVLGPPATDAPAPPAAPEVQVPSGQPAPADPLELEPNPNPLPPPPAPPTYRITPPEKPGPPFYTQDEVAELRDAYEVPPPDEPPRTSSVKRRLRCLVADPACGFNVEINATSAYALSLRQGNVDEQNDVMTWSTGRAQYDVWLNFPVASEPVGKLKYTRLTIGPKGGVMASDSSRLWSNFGLATRYWFGRGSWAPALEVTAGLSFSLRGERAGDVEPRRSPIGLTADVGLNVGGWGAIVVGGQFDPPLAREELPEAIRIASGGMFFVGLRGNIVWGLPALTAVGTHAIVQRTVEAP